MPRSVRNFRFLIVATDYFTKWVEADPLVHIRDSDAKKFVWKNIITRFGIPRALVTDNGKQFEGKAFKNLCDRYGIKHFFSTLVYPQSNGQAESSNKTLLDGMKKRLTEVKGRWVNELPSVLWAYRTTPWRSTGETSFSLAYGMEAVILFEIGLPTTRMEAYCHKKNKERVAEHFDMIEEQREWTLIKLAAYEQQLAQSFKRRVRERVFKVGDLVLRKVLPPTMASLVKTGKGHTRSQPFGGTGTYYLETLEGKVL